MPCKVGSTENLWFKGRQEYWKGFCVQGRLASHILKHWFLIYRIWRVRMKVPEHTQITVVDVFFWNENDRNEIWN